MARRLLCVLMFLSCAGPRAPSSKTLDVNDVSFLYPLQASGMLPLVDGFISHATFDALLDRLPPTPGFEPKNDWQTWHLVSVRVDSCARKTIGDPCGQELRLVAQPIHTADGTLQSRDQAIHLIYEVDGSAIDDVVWALKALAGASTNGVPLGVHPVLKEEGIGGAYGKTLEAFVRKNAIHSSLKRLAVMIENASGQNWEFAVAQPTHGTAVVSLAIEQAGDADMQSLLIGGRIAMTPPSNATDNLNPFFEGEVLSNALTATLVQAALRIDNPEKNTPHSVDCVSCHTASHVLQELKGDAFAEAQNGNPDRYASPPNKTIVAEPKAALMNVHAFSYFFAAPAASLRTQNDSARVAAHIEARR